MRCVAAVLVAGLAACTPFAVTPPARTFALDSPSTPAVGHGDVQLDAAGATSGLWGPNASSLGGQLRTAIAPDAAMNASVEQLTVGDGGDHAYAGRVGAVLANDDHDAALTFGAGGGNAAAAGSWGSVDLGGVVSGTYHWIRPMAAVSVGYGQPFVRRQFTASNDDDPVVLQLPSNFIFRLDLGLELGPPRYAVIVGLSAVEFVMTEPDVVSGPGDPNQNQGFMVAGLATRISLD